jgi:TetR/AcrR family transcriptional regulator
MSADQPGTSSQKRMSADERREHIENAARRVFIAQGLKGSRIRDIAAEAGINEALLYRHFASKEELFTATIVEPLREVVALRAEADSVPPAAAQSSQEEMVERTRLYIRSLLEVMEDIAPLLGAVMFDGEESASDHYKEIVEPVLKQTAHSIRTNLTWWDHRAFDVEGAVRVAFGAVWFEVIVARLEGRPVNAEAFARELAQTIVLGNATRC